MAVTSSDTHLVTLSDGRICLWDKREQILQGWPVMHQMYPHLTLESYQERIQAALQLDYRQFVYLDNKDVCRGIVGLWLFPRIWCGLQADIDHFIVDAAYRSAGIGQQLIEQCLVYAKQRGADVAVLDTFVDNPASHKFYFREGFTIRGYHFVKPLKGQSIW